MAAPKVPELLRRKRGPNLRTVIAAALAAGATVVVERGGALVVKPKEAPINGEASANPWDAELAGNDAH